MAKSLIHAFRARGASLLDSLQGDFCIAVINQHEPAGLIAIDRMGIHGLYYSILGHELHFGSRLARLFSSREVPQDVDPQALFNYVYFHVIPSPRTIYSDIHKLEPAQCLVWDHCEPRLKSYWTPSFAPPSGRGNTDHLALDVRDSIEQAVRRCDKGEHAGAFLSGGLDSSTVSGMLRRVRGAAVPTFSIGFQETGYDELPYARIAARHFGLTAHEHYVSVADIEHAVPLMASFFDEPFGNSSAIPAYICARFAREQGTRVLLAGDGGDELFAGNERYARQKLFELYAYAPPWFRTRILEPWLGNGRPPQTLWPLRKLQRYIEQAATALPARLEAHNLMHALSIDKVFDHGLLDEIDVTEPLRELDRRYHSVQANNALDRMLFLDWKITLADNDLRKVNAACAVAGVDVRYPMLDEEVVDVSTRIPAAEKLKRFKLRAFYKSAFQDFLPREIIGKPKHGFGLPFGQWLTASPRLRELIDDTLTDLKKRGLFAATFIEEVRQSHRDRHAAYFGTQLWVLFMLEQWWQHRSESETTEASLDGGNLTRAGQIGTP
ncbi:MAG TPA: asparagine synthase-related protein [Gammaproteobacteria bacterium]|nr:asparagine synthase-related protein [Gammaproteobacteria bacterium]